VTVLRSGSATDVGRVRKINQDLPLETTNLYAVADGMGGHVGGEVAARLAVDALRKIFTREPTTEGLEEAFAEANRAVWQESLDKSDLRGMGTTLTAMALVGGADGRDMLALGNVGDSRAYVFSEGELKQVTFDHSLAEERMRHGEMTEEEAAVHPQRHILTRALGVSPDVETDMWQMQLRSGDRVVLCSDGLSNELSEQEIARVLTAQSDPTEAARQLVATANEHGGADNITVVVVDVLIGEEGTTPLSVVTPIGSRAGVPLVVTQQVVAERPADGDTGVVQAVPGGVPVAASTESQGAVSGATEAPPDTLAPGAQLGFTRNAPRLSTDGPQSGENFLGNTATVPIARSTARAEGPARPAAARPPKNESWGARRRRLGIPRRITVRVLLFALLVAAVPTGAFFAIRWYAYDNWFVSIQANQIVIQQGHRGGVLWFNPKVVDQTGVTTAQVLATSLTDIHNGVQEPSLDAAKKYVANLQQEFQFQQNANGGLTGGTATTGPTTPP
jgi:serine/threonine protein phosphatase PrpC